MKAKNKKLTEKREIEDLRNEIDELKKSVKTTFRKINN